MRRIVDIDRIVAVSPRFDWTYVAQAASASGLDLVLAVSLRVAHLLLGTEVPSELSRGTGLPPLSRIHLAMLDPVAWVVSLPSERRAVACDTIRLWCARTWSARMDRAAETLRGVQTVAMNADGAEAPRGSRWSVADSSAARATKLGLYHVLLYWRSGLALASPSGRRRLRFWN